MIFYLMLNIFYTCIELMKLSVVTPVFLGVGGSPVYRCSSIKIKSNKALVGSDDCL